MDPILWPGDQEVSGPQTKRLQPCRRATFGLATILLLVVPAHAQYLGVTCGWSYGNDLTGPYTDTANNPLFHPITGNPNNTWDDWADELGVSGVDFVCPNLRGSGGFASEGSRRWSIRNSSSVFLK